MKTKVANDIKSLFEQTREIERDFVQARVELVWISLILETDIVPLELYRVKHNLF